MMSYPSKNASNINDLLRLPRPCAVLENLLGGPVFWGSARRWKKTVDFNLKTENFISETRNEHFPSNSRLHL